MGNTLSSGTSKFSRISLQANTNCAADSATYYFVRNATGTTAPFTVDTNTSPEIGNFVFTDPNGATYVNDTNTIQYIITEILQLLE